MEAPQTETPKLEANGAQIARIARWVALLTVVLVSLLYGLDRLVRSTVREQVLEKRLAPESLPLRKLHADEALKLGRWQWIDREKGIVRIPVERAIELTLKEWESRPTGFKPVPAESGPAK